MAIDATSKVANNRRRLWNGAKLSVVGGAPANGEQQRSLSSTEAEDRLVAFLTELEQDIDPHDDPDDFRVDVLILRGDVEQRRAQRRRR